MTDTPSEREGDSTWARLRRRKVVQWGLAYAAAAWTLLQVIEYFGETYAWPPAVRQIAGIALPLGLALVLVVAWYHGDKGDQKISRTEAGILLALTALVGGTLWWYISRLDASAWVAQSVGPTSNDVAPAAPPFAPPEQSIAVLPFVDMSERKDQEYFADGLSEELIDLLARIPDLRVPARTSSFYFKGKAATVADIARALNVAAVLEGSVRKSGNRVRITAQLVRADSGYHLWSQTYDREMTDVFKVQDEIAAAVVEALKVTLLPSAAAKGLRTANPEAHLQYLLGRQFLGHFTNERSLRQARQAFEKAVALDPEYAAAYAGLAVTEMELVGYVGDDLPAGLERASVAASRAIELGPNLANGYVARGYLRYLWLWDWAGARADFEHGLALEPNNAQALSMYALLLDTEGEFAQAIDMAKRSVELDPLAARSWAYLYAAQFAAGNQQESRKALSRVLEIDPENSNALAGLGELDLIEGHPEQALARFRKVPSEYVRLLGVSSAEYSLGHLKESQDSLDQLIRTQQKFAAAQIAMAYAWRGDKDQAFAWLERAYAQRDSGLIVIKFTFYFDPIRDDPRYKAFLRKMNLPE